MTTLLICLFAFMPVIDGQRVNYGTYQAPYNLGVSIRPEENVIVKAYQSGELLFTHTQGTAFNLARIETNYPVDFYGNGVYQGSLIPEPCTLVLLVAGAMIIGGPSTKWRCVILHQKQGVKDRNAHYLIKKAGPDYAL